MTLQMLCADASKTHDAEIMLWHYNIQHYIPCTRYVQEVVCRATFEGIASMINNNDYVYVTTEDNYMYYNRLKLCIPR